ncbi:MAG: M1 family aminopeptidase [Candidatus Promineifilaceae bacterium]
MPEFESLAAAWMDGRQAPYFENPNVPLNYPPDLEIEPRHLDIDLQVDLAAKTAAGKVTTTVRARHQGPSEITLDAVDFHDLAVQDPEGNTLTWLYDGNKLQVQWTEPFEDGEERRLEVAYRIVEPVDGLYFSKPNDAYPDQPWFAATDHETERARYWLPSIDLPNVRTTLEFHLRAEDRFTILANGYLVGEAIHDDGTKTAHWKLDQLCPSYLVCFAIGDFVRADDGFVDDGEKQIELAYFATRDYEAEALIRSFGRTGSIMEWMTAKLAAPFPFPKYYQFALSEMGGAMENISLVSWGDWAILDEELADEFAQRIDAVNVHEMAHSYFGDAVVVRDFAHAWLKESWATYIEQCWAEDVLGVDEGNLTYYEHTKEYLQEADERYKRPLVTRRFKSSWQLYDRHLYPGGACRLHTLRQELGDGVFWPAVQDYLRRYDGRVVETDDFRRVMEEHSGRSLGKFFDQWFHSPGYPDIKVTFRYDSKQKTGTFEIEQKQVDEEKGIPIFELSTDVGWTVNGQTHLLPVKLDEAKHVVTVPMAEEPEQVRFDPQAKVLHKLSFNPGDPMLRRQLRLAKDVMGRILAANELAKTGKQANIEAIVEAYGEEPSWGARREFLDALADSKSETAIEGLAQILEQEQNPRVLSRVFRAAGAYRDSRIKRAVADRLNGRLPPMARGTAYRTMGGQREEADWELLLAGTREPGYQGRAQSGAFAGLAATRRSDAVDILLEQVPYGVQSNWVRPAIVSALADIGQGLEKVDREKVVEMLTDLLRDPWRYVRWEAATGLVKMKATESLEALEAFSRSLSQQSRVHGEELVTRLRASDKVDGSALKKDVEELQEKVRKLEDQLQKLQAKVKPPEENE